MKTRIRNLVALIVLALSISTLASVPASANGVDGACGSFEFAGGNGTQNSPFLVNNASSLNELRDCSLAGSYYYKQTQNIELTGFWTPINYFTGNYNGDGKTISGISVIQASQQNGLFKTIMDAEVYNLLVIGSVQNDSDYTGLLAGYVENTSIHDITARPNVIGNSFTGGLIGAAVDSTFERVFADSYQVNASVSGNGNNVGGLVGYLENTDIDSAAVNINVNNSGWYSGLGGVYGNAHWTSGTYFQHSDLSFVGNLTNTENGAYQCGGIAGISNYAISNVFVGGAIECESHDVGGVVGISTNSISKARVEADITINAVDDSNAGYFEAGGIVGWWQPGDGSWELTESSFHGTISNKTIAGGLVGVMAVDNVDENTDFLFSLNSVNATLSNEDLVGGYVGLFGYNSDPQHTQPNIQITDSYTAIEYGPDVQIKEPLIYTDFVFDIHNLIWVNSDGNISTALEDQDGVRSLETVKATFPGYWVENNFDMTETWGISSEFNDRLPVLREFNDVTFDIACQVKSFPDIHFTKNSTTLNAKAKKQIRSFANELLNGYCTHIYVAAFASGKELKKGKAKLVWQQKLSEKRLNSTLNYLNSRITVSEVEIQIFANALGSNYKKNKDKTKKQQAANRRAELGTTS